MYELMLKFGPQKLFEEFAQQYIIEYGNEKFEKIASLVKSSDKVSQYISSLVINNSYPQVSDLQFVMNNHTYKTGAVTGTCF